VVASKKNKGTVMKRKFKELCTVQTRMRNLRVGEPLGRYATPEKVQGQGGDQHWWERSLFQAASVLGVKGEFL
jgi:hypothetical protein